VGGSVPERRGDVARPYVAGWFAACVIVAVCGRPARRGRGAIPRPRLAASATARRPRQRHADDTHASSLVLPPVAVQSRQSRSRETERLGRGRIALVFRLDHFLGDHFGRRPLAAVSLHLPRANAGFFDDVAAPDRPRLIAGLKATPVELVAGLDVALALLGRLRVPSRVQLGPGEPAAIHGLPGRIGLDRLSVQPATTDRAHDRHAARRRSLRPAHL